MNPLCWIDGKYAFHPNLYLLPGVMSVFAPLFLCCRRLGLYFQVVVNGNTLVDFADCTFISLQDLFLQIIFQHWFCNPTSLPWGPIKPEASSEDTFWGLALAAWSHWCICQKHAATSHVTNWLLCESSEKALRVFLEQNYDAEVSVGPVLTSLNSPETHECSIIIRHLISLLLLAFCHKACGYSAMDWLTLWALPAEDSPWKVPWRQGEWEKDKKNPSDLCSPGRMKWVLDYRPECPIKDSRGCCFYIQQHHSKSGKGQNGHEENKAPHFSPAIIAEGWETFTFFHHLPQKVSI